MNYILNFLKNVKNLCLAMFRGKIYWNVDIGEFNHFNNNAKIYGPYCIKHVTVGKGTYIAQNSIITHVEIGKFCSIGPNFFCGWGIHPINGFSTSPVFYSMSKQLGFTYSSVNKIEERKQIIIGNDVFIGANVTILDGVTIGDGAVIGAGAVVSKDIPPYAIAVGSPIQIKKYRYSNEIIEELLDLQWWNQDEEILKKVEAYFFDIEEFIFYMKDIQNNKN